jgi:CheY-like chemotaxis protein
LIILDLMLGRDLTGWAVLEILRADPLLAHIPVIMCPAAAPALRKCEGLRAVEAVAKPFDVDHLLGVVDRLLARSAVALV